MPPARLNPFREWLDNHQFDTLLEVLKSQADTLEVECVNNRVQSGGGDFSTYEVKAQNKAREADALHRTMKLLTDLRAAKSFNVSTHKLF